MRVLVIAQYFPPDMGGGATRAYNMAIGLRKNGCKVTVIAAVPHYPHGKISSKYKWRPFVIEYSEGIRIIRTFVPPLKSAGFFNRLILFATFMLSSLFPIYLASEFDMIWTANPNITATFSGFFYKRIKKCPLIQNVDDLWPEALYDLGLDRKSLLGRLGEIAAQISYSLSDLITPISSGYTRVLTGKYRVSKNRIKTIKAGVKLQQFPLNKNDNSNGNSFSVVYVGAFSPAYDFYQIISAAKILENYDDISFLIQGSGESAEFIKRTIQTCGTKNVKLREVIVSRDEVAKILLNADLLLLPLAGKGAIDLGISSKIYEYQASGKPILCCSSGESAKYIQESNSGIVVKPGLSKEIAEAILQLRSNPDLARKLGENGRKYVENNLSIEQTGKELLDFFKSRFAIGMN